ncbi:hypothetical protein [Mycobacteroides abscessus]|uniref:hypothetical protein n=1 Tax=Mycobacteroides abscessus TaxID=36809 RepID=UPI0009B0C1DA|nr:hypothetical protein [Mycobacteroides abscessus]SLL18451.1 Uncharacterised protein [Mycobacteroides abscessus subsp. abscessus]
MSSLAALQSEVQGYRDEAAHLSEDFQQAHAEVGADPSLTTVGKREHLEPLHREVTEKIAALHAREKAAVKSTKEKIERRIFGLSPSASSDPARLVSFRDAQSRARQLHDSADAAELYQSALRSGDDVLATAVLERALVRGWSAIKEDFLERHASARADLDDLGALAKYSENGLFNVGHYMPPTLNLPHSAGFPNVPALHSRGEHQGPVPLPDWMR